MGCMLFAAFYYNSNHQVHTFVLKLQCIAILIKLQFIVILIKLQFIVILIKLQFIVILIKLCAFDGLNCNN
jgi:hypothetical protein